MDIKEAKDLVGQDLSGFSVRELTEVYTVNEDGRYDKSVGFFEDEQIAMAFAKNQVDAPWHKTSTEVVLTDGKVGFTFRQKTGEASQ